MKFLARLVWALFWLILIGATAWVFGALWFDFPVQEVRHIVAGIYAFAMVAAAIVAALYERRRTGGKMAVADRRYNIQAGAVPALGFIIVLGWWLTLRPSNDRAWQPDVARTAWAEINGDQVTLHNVRKCEYRTETDYTPHWETRVVDLKQLRGIDLAITYWGSKWIAHPIVSFQFGDVLPICFSIETRLEVGEEYSAIGGLYRRCELIYVCADERDVIRVRSNFRKGEDVYLYHTTISPAEARQRFLEYIAVLNSLHSQPRWYNAVTTNCTTSIRTQHAAAQRVRWDWRILLNGFLDQMLYEHGALAGNLPFAELKAQAHINEAARAANDVPDFSVRIRAGRPGFSEEIETSGTKVQ
jgi:hypothetical protein